MKIKNIGTAALAFAVLLLFTGCGDLTAPAKAPASGESLCFTPSVYYGNYGKISFLYEAGVDEVVPQQDTNEVLEVSEEDDTAEGPVGTEIHQKDVVSITDGSGYSLVISYEAGTRDLTEQEETLKSSLTQMDSAYTDSTVSIVGPISEGKFGHDTYRCISMITSENGMGRLHFGNTASGYFEVYYLLQENATPEQAEHMVDVLNSITFSQYTENDLIYDDNSTVYIKTGD